MKLSVSSKISQSQKKGQQYVAQTSDLATAHGEIQGVLLGAIQDFESEEQVREKQKSRQAMTSMKNATISKEGYEVSIPCENKGRVLKEIYNQQ